MKQVLCCAWRSGPTSALVPGRKITPVIKLVDHTPDKKSPINHIHCDACEAPVGRVVRIEAHYQYDRMALFLCKKCLKKALKLLEDK